MERRRSSASSLDEISASYDVPIVDPSSVPKCVVADTLLHKAQSSLRWTLRDAVKNIPRSYWQNLKQHSYRQAITKGKIIAIIALGFSRQGSPHQINRLRIALSHGSSSVTPHTLMSSLTSSINLLNSYCAGLLL
ncbi:hypothetical protein SK128_001340 [Halocaridina rubra]|uniref:Uncharacterized protein n=1 Tax=Halocaridina rubra TaxID=373956 RepID=A0AAN9A8W6_HALRR